MQGIKKNQQNYWLNWKTSPIIMLSWILKNKSVSAADWQKDIILLAELKKKSPKSSVESKIITKDNIVKAAEKLVFQNPGDQQKMLILEAE